MPRIILGLPETEISITRPVVLGVVNELFEMTGIPADTRIFYPGDTAKTMQPGLTGAVGSVIGSNEDKVLFAQHGKVFIEAQEAPDEDSAQLSDAFKQEHPYLFLDDQLDIYVKPSYKQMEVKISFRYRAADKTAAVRWKNEIMARMQARLEVRLHTLEYRYPVPMVYIYILEQLYKLRENMAGYGEDFRTYFTDHSSQRLTWIVDQSGENPSLVLPETQGRVQGWFDFGETPEEGSREGDTANWNIAFTYTFKYTKPVAAIMGYPIMIHQQMVPQKIRPDPQKDVPSANTRKKRYMSNSWNALYQFEAEQDYIQTRAKEGRSIPYYDEFVPRTVPLGTQRFFTALCSVDPTSPRSLCNLKDIKAVVFTDEIYDYISKVVGDLSPTYGSVFTLDLYEGFTRLPADRIKMDADFNITSTFDLDLRKQYRIRFAIVTEFDRLRPSAIASLRANGHIFIQILSSLFPGLAWLYEMIGFLMSDGSVPLRSWKEVLRNITTLKPDVYPIGLFYGPRNTIIAEALPGTTGKHTRVLL